MNDKNNTLAQHALFSVSVLFALVVVTSVGGDLLGWWQSPLGIEVMLIIVVGSLLLTLVASHLRRHRLGSA